MTLGETRISSSLATFELLQTEKGTDLIFTEQGAFFEVTARNPRSRLEEAAGVLGGLPFPIASRTRKRFQAMPDKQPDIQRIFHALGDPTRRAIVERLGAGPISVSRLAEPLNMTLAAVVQHLQILEQSGLVRTEKIGRVRTCRINPKGLDAIQQWVEERRSIWRIAWAVGDLLAKTEEQA